MRQAVLAALGIALLPTYMIGADLQRNALRALLPGHHSPETSLFATYLLNRYLAAKVRVFVDYLVTRFGPVPHWDVDHEAGARMAPGRGNGVARTL